jgi:glutathione S-transferase
MPETRISIEYLALPRPGSTPLVPADPVLALETRLWDRFFDLYVGMPMAKIVTDKLRPPGRNDPDGVAEAQATLRRAYDLVEARLPDRPWASGQTFGLADCAAAPALFYAEIVLPFSGTHPRLAAYFDRLLERPSVARTLEEARPWFHLFPLRERIPARFGGPVQ